jgi:hypothetical protein
MPSPVRGLTERGAEVFLLDILSHRMSETAIIHQLTIVSHHIAVDGASEADDKFDKAARGLHECGDTFWETKRRDDNRNIGGVMLISGAVSRLSGRIAGPAF